MIGRMRFLAMICAFLLPVVVRGQGVTTAPIDQALGRSGQKTGEVYKVSFPRTDLHVSVHGVAIKPGLALGSWAAFLGTDDNSIVMGDLVLLQDELDPVMAKLRSSGFEITAVHNHLLEESPRVIYMHYMGHGAAAELEKLTANPITKDAGTFVLPPLKFPTPMIGLAVEPKSRADQQKISGALHKITEEDQTFVLTRESQTKEMVIRGMSELHLDVIQQRLKNRFKLDINTHIPHVPYLETITGTA